MNRSRKGDAIIYDVRTIRLDWSDVRGGNLRATTSIYEPEATDCTFFSIRP
jgi:hypothetical protein